uniref:hypothetical protein n=1 Tax=Ferrimicrobium sp. TaxID=2926050 RepID=UPI0026262719
MVDHLPRPTWVVVVCLGSQPLSGSFVLKTRISDTVAGGPQRDDACSNSAFLSALEPLVQDGLHLGVGGVGVLSDRS